MSSLSGIRVGTAGWSYKDWEGIFYPGGMQRRKEHPLDYVARCFDVVEINSSFYGHIKPEIAKVWVRKVHTVNPQFLFTAKLHRSFTHSPAMYVGPTSAATIRPSPEDSRLAREGLDALAGSGKLGALLIQFPVSFKNSSLNREYIEELVDRFAEFPRVIEVRHDTWDNPETMASFARKNIAFCNIDQPQIGHSLEPTDHVTADLAYVRFHGRNYDQWFEPEEPHDRYNYLYSDSELLDWKAKIEKMAKTAKTTYVISNNHYEAKGAANALQIRNMLSGKRQTAPESLIRNYPALRDIADPLPTEDDRLLA